MNLIDRPTLETNAAAIRFREFAKNGANSVALALDFARRLEQQRDAAVEALQYLLVDWIDEIGKKCNCVDYSGGGPCAACNACATIATIKQNL